MSTIALWMICLFLTFICFSMSMAYYLQRDLDMAMAFLYPAIIGMGITLFIYMQASR
jgi:ABC-type long-subunit fatty acid transport system fused permease/ATPase subunit